LAIQIAAHFRFVEDWYQGGSVVALVLSYYAGLRSVLRAQAELRRCLTRCRHCGIFFLTHPRNAGREDLRCPFGCRQAHRRHQSDQRSTAYYRDEAGKEKKRTLNAKRRKRPPPPPAPPSPLLVDEFPSAWPQTMLPYLQMVISLIEGRPVSLAEVVAVLRRALRQHRIARTRRIDHTVGWLHAEPP
jgi:hypothetical protein